MLNLLIGNCLTHDNNSIYWMSTDSPSTFRENCEKHGDSFKKKWSETCITYILNSQGYRCPEWDEINWQDSILLFGDSCVAGVGVAEKQTLSYLLSKKLCRPVINLGVGGSSNLFSLYNMIEIKRSNISPYAVINIETCKERTLTFSKIDVGNTGIDHWGSWDMDKLHYKRFWLYHEENYLRHDEYIKENKRFLWEGTKYLSYNWESDPRFTEKTTEFARDNLHPAVDTFKKQARLIDMDWCNNGWMD